MFGHLKTVLAFVIAGSVVLFSGALLLVGLYELFVMLRWAILGIVAITAVAMVIDWAFRHVRDYLG